MTAEHLQVNVRSSSEKRREEHLDSVANSGSAFLKNVYSRPTGEMQIGAGPESALKEHYFHMHPSIRCIFSSLSELHL